MALAYAQSLGDGSNRIFQVPFPYISKTHVQVKVDGTIVPYTWLSLTSVQLATAPVAGSIVDRRRVTPRDTVLVDFVDGSTLVESDLDLATMQVFFLAQEAFDLGEASLGVTDDGSFSALGRRIANLLDPSAAHDAVNRQWAESAMSSQLYQASQKASAAGASQAAALASENNAASSATSANTSKNTATTKAAEAAQSAADALASKNTATTKATEAATSATEAKGYRDTALTKASEAAASAAQAALFDPANFYTKTQLDAALKSNGRRNLTVSSDVPANTAGADGDVHYQI